jgi:riboflavin kinase/FMN adenylyltransferase
MIFKGVAVAGRGRARTLGFSTINLKVLDAVEIPDGVYGVKATIHSHDFLAAMHAGASPTFDDTERTVELHLIGIQESDIATYHLDALDAVEIEVEILNYLRTIMKFNSREELVKQIAIDVHHVLKGKENQ